MQGFMAAPPFRLFSARELSAMLGQPTGGCGNGRRDGAGDLHGGAARAARVWAADTCAHDRAGPPTGSAGTLLFRRQIWTGNEHGGRQSRWSRLRPGCVSARAWYARLSERTFWASVTPRRDETASSVRSWYAKRKCLLRCDRSATSLPKTAPVTKMARYAGREATGEPNR